jgi:hypothetical protein
LLASRCAVSDANRKVLAGLRLVATLPPRRFFGANNLARAIDQIAALRNLGAAVYEFDTEAVYANDLSKIEQQKNDIRAFRADAVIGTPHAGYVVQGGMLRPSAISLRQVRRNLFIDELDLPVLLFWDHALTQAARYLLDRWPAYPWESQAGALAVLTGIFSHPNAAHFFPDSGHAEALGKMGIASLDEDSWYVQEVGNTFAECGLRADGSESYQDDVAFFGNIYLADSNRIPYSSDPAVAELRARARASCTADWSLSAFHAYSDAIATLDPGRRTALRLEPNQSFFWRFMFDELSRFMNGEDRLRVLQACGRAVTYYGNFNDTDSTALMAGQYSVRGALPYDATLGNAFRRTRVTVDVVNAPFINGFSVKLVVCFAAGGFLLTNRKADIARALGPLADEIIYDDADELSAKVEHFLTHDRKRLELSREIGDIVRRQYTAEALFARTLPAALERLRANGTARSWRSRIRRLIPIR